MFAKFFRQREEPPESVPISRQLEILHSCGISFKVGLDYEKIIRENFSVEDIQENPFLPILTIMGDLVEGATGFSHFNSDNIWHFDTECITCNGDYAAILERMSRLTGNRLPLEDINDRIDMKKKSASVSFSLDGQMYRWNAKVNNDWVDSSILYRLAKLLKDRNAGKLFTYLNLGGQDCLIGCSSKDELESFKRATRLPLEWLKTDSY